MKKNILFLFSVFIALQSFSQNNILVFQSDFGLRDGAVSAMKGVSMGVSDKLKIFDLTHEIPSYNIWEAAYRLEQTIKFWPKGTVFVSIVDPGVGTNRISVVVKTKSGHFVVTPDNGTLTLIEETMGIEEMRQIDEGTNRLPNSYKSYTFHGRDVYAFTGAKLASNSITFEQVGPLLPTKIVTIPHKKADIKDDIIEGNIPILDVQYGNIWTNISEELIKKLNINYTDWVEVKFYHLDQLIYQTTMPFHESFGNVAKGKPLMYLNSLLQVSFALNVGDFSNKYKIYSGSNWNLTLKKIKSQ